MFKGKAQGKSNSISLYRYKDGLGRFDYERYRAVQNQGNASKLDKQWAKQENIAYYAEYLKRQLPKPPVFGLCHGTRRGSEQRWFRDATGASVLGTEIGDSAENFDSTIQWDFHEVKPEWENSVDFIYSNSLDHSYDPELALKSWISCLRPGGLLLIEHSDRHEPVGSSPLDPFGITLAELVLLITRLGAGMFWVESLLEELPRRRKPPGYLVCLVVRKRPSS